MLCSESITLASLYALSGSSLNSNQPGRPTLCRSCSAIVGAGEAKCAVCGASTAVDPTNTRQVGPDRETIRFARAVLNRPYKFTITFLVANIFVYLLMWDSSGLGRIGLFEDFNPVVLVAYGAKVNALIAAPNHQWWRFIAPMFIHVNLFHLLINMYSLWMLGPFVEKLYGSAKFVMFWVLTGIAGVVASYLTVRPSLATNMLSSFVFKAFDEPSAGASGALFGLVGVLFVFGIKFRHELPEGFKRAFGTGLLPVILLNLFIGFVGSRSIDNAAHLGGLLSGAALALVVDYRRPGDSQSSAIVWRVLQLASLVIVVLSFFKVVQRFNLPPPPPQVNQLDVFVGYVHGMTQAQEMVSALMSDHDLSGVPATIAGLKSMRAPDPKAEELRQRLLTLLNKISVQPTPTTSAPRLEQSIEKNFETEYAAWRKDYDAWLKTTARTLTH